MLSYTEYEKILTKGKKIDWYGTQVPEKLITETVKAMANQIVEQINKYEGVDSKSKKGYICELWENVKLLPYKINGDVFLLKKKEIESRTNLKSKNDSIKEPEQKVTKNSNLIFGNKTK